MSAKVTPFVLVAVVLAWLPVAARADVYLNGVNITGVTNQTFEKATVTIDAQGNVRIDAPGYAVAGGTKTSDAAPTAAAAPTTPSRHYYVVTSHAQPGASQYDIDLYVNAKWVRKLRSKEDQLVFDITRWLSPGQNKILLVATKQMSSGRTSRSPAHYFRVVVGEGNEGGNNVMIERTLVDFKVTAEDTQDVSREFVVTVH